MSNDIKKSSGEFEMPRFRLRVAEDVEFRPDMAERFNVGAVIDTIAKMEKNPCAECPAILDLVRLLAYRSGREPEEMKKLDIRCRPTPDDTEFYEVSGSLTDNTSQALHNVRCQLVWWMTQNLPSQEGK